mmetsp:Transcript_28338/g.92542  ORF Transcript_28338/g.92542 Transcript_28338/m.92542 type:complete len:888 (-) Transcript_28338:70-2733(-)
MERRPQELPPLRTSVPVAPATEGGEKRPLLEAAVTQQQAGPPSSDVRQLFGEPESMPGQVNDISERVSGLGASAKKYIAAEESGMEEERASGILKHKGADERAGEATSEDDEDDHDGLGSRVGADEEKGPYTSYTALAKRLRREERRRNSVKFADVPMMEYTPPSTISPNHKYMRFWDILSLFLLAFTAIVTPFEIGFLEPKFDSLFVINRIVDFCFLIDLLINFNLQYYDPHLARMETRRHVISKHYLRGWFMIDLISLLPYDILNLTGAGEFSNLRVLRIIRLMRLAKLLRILRAGRLFQRMEASMALDYGLLMMVSFFGNTIMISHWTACLWRILPHLQGESGMNWMHTIPWNSDWFGEEVDGIQPEDRPVFDLYMCCVYFAVLTMTSVGYGDVLPTNTLERFGAVVTMLVGSYFFGFIVGSITSILGTRNARMNEFYRVMDELNSFIKERKLDYTLSRKLRDYFKYRHSRSDEMSLSNSHELLEKMSPALRGEVAATTNHGWMTKLDFFHGAPEEFTIQVALAMDSSTFAPDELVIVRGEQALFMFVVQRGIVASEGRIYTAGKVLGEDMLVSRNNLEMLRDYDARALTYVDCMRLSRDEIANILPNFPAIQESLRKLAMRKLFANEVIAYSAAMRWLLTGKRGGSILASRSNREQWYYDKLSQIVRVDRDEMRELNEKVSLIQRAYKRSVLARRRNSGSHSIGAAVMQARAMNQLQGDINVRLTQISSAQKHHHHHQHQHHQQHQAPITPISAIRSASVPQLSMRTPPSSFNASRSPARSINVRAASAVPAAATAAAADPMNSFVHSHSEMAKDVRALAAAVILLQRQVKGNQDFMESMKESMDDLRAAVRGAGNGEASEALVTPGPNPPGSGSTVQSHAPL